MEVRPLDKTGMIGRQDSHECDRHKRSEKSKSTNHVAKADRRGRYIDSSRYHGKTQQVQRI